MNFFKSTCLVLMVLSFSTLAEASKISFSFFPTLTSGTDPNGLENTTWLFEFDLSQLTYQLSGTFSYTPASIPEPQLIILFLLGTGICLSLRRWKRG